MNRALIERTLAAMEMGWMGPHHAEYFAVQEALKAELSKPEPVAWLSTDCTGERYMCFTKPTELYHFTRKEPQMFDYKSESLAWSITAENAEYRESLLKQELLANSITMENLRVVTPEMIDAANVASEKWQGAIDGNYIGTIYLAMLEAA